MASWPGSSVLPQVMEYNSYHETMPNNVLRTKMAVGPPKLRRRATAAVRPLSGSMVLDSTQVTILDTFYTSTLSDGVTAFDWTRPRATAVASFRFVKPPEYIAIADNLWRVKLELEELP